MKQKARSIISALLIAATCIGQAPAALAGQQNSYHDPAEHWQQAANRTNELDANAVVTRETMFCYECGKQTSFESFRTPEYSRTGKTALNRGVKYSDGTMVDGESKGNVDAGTPGIDGYYTAYHWSKAVCETCGTINANMAKTDYGHNVNVYWLYDCAGDFTQKLPETVSYEYTDSKYHTKITESGEYCGFCYGTHKETDAVLERHDLKRTITPQLGHQRFAVKDACTLCDYEKVQYIAAKAVVASYFGVADGKPHTISVTDLSESGVSTKIRYGTSADSCNLTSAPNYTEKGQYTVYYEITYTFDGESMTENGAAYVWLRGSASGEDGSGCGCNDPDCGCEDKDCMGDCCSDKSCGEQHQFVLLESVEPTCFELGYDRYLCTACGKIEKRDYVDSLEHAWQSVVIREATCETEGKVLKICSRCGLVETEHAQKGEHKYETYTVGATCVNPGCTVKECTVCGDRHITDMTATLPHDYEAAVTPAACETGGRTTHICHGCNSSFVTDYTDALGHAWDDGTVVTDKTCDGSGVTEYRCTRCGYHRLEGDASTGHVPGAAATCTEPQICTVCGVVLKLPTGHKPGDWIIDKEPTKDSEGEKHKECENCGETLATETIDKIRNSAVTDENGEAVVGGYLVIVTDTDTESPILGAAVTLREDDSLGVRLPNGRLLDYDDQTTVTVKLVKDRSPVVDMFIAVTDKNKNHAADATNKTGQITVPDGSSETDENGNATVGGKDEDGDRITLTVKVEHYETGRPVEHAYVSIHKNGTIIVVLPDGVDMDAEHRITVTVMDNQKNPQEDMDVTVKDDLGGKERGETDEDGKLTVPEAAKTVRHAAYIVGYPDGTVRPHGNMTRAEAVSVFARLLAEKNGDRLSGYGAAGFSDIPMGAWYAPAVRYLSGYGVATGYADKTFRPNQTITRAEFTTMAVKFFAVYGDGNAEIMEKYDGFKDVSSGDWAAEYIEDAAKHGWIVGYGDGLFHSNAKITRAEVVTLVNNLLDREADEEYIAENLRRLNTFTDLTSTRYWAYFDVMEAANSHNAALGETERWSK